MKTGVSLGWRALADYRMVGSDEFEASRTVMQALTGKSPDVQTKVLCRVIDAAYRSELDMTRLKEILDGCRN